MLFSPFLRLYSIVHSVSGLLLLVMIVENQEVGNGGGLEVGCGLDDACVEKGWTCTDVYPSVVIFSGLDGCGVGFVISSLC